MIPIARTRSLLTVLSFSASLVGVLAVAGQALGSHLELLPVGSEFQVNTYTTRIQAGSSVSLEADGDFVVVWESDGSAGSDTWNWGRVEPGTLVNDHPLEILVVAGDVAR